MDTTQGLCGLSVEDITTWPPVPLGDCARIADHHTGCLTATELTVTALLEDRAQLLANVQDLTGIAERAIALANHLSGIMSHLAALADHPGTDRLIADIRKSPAAATGDPAIDPTNP